MSGKWVGTEWVSDSPHPQNEVAVGQIMLDGKWVDYARATPRQAIYWAENQPEGEARVVDWIGKRDVIWPQPPILDALPAD